MGTFIISVPIKSVATNYDSTGTQATLNYQACSGAICIAPAKVKTGLNATANTLDLKKNSGKLGATTPTLSQATAQPSAAPSTTQNSLPLLFLLAFIGGLILNLMPCVLPVLSIKALSLAKHARESRRKLLYYGFSMSLGILVSFWTLAGVVIAVQKAGGSAGWGFQFQNPTFLVVMTILITLFALNLFGVFEIWLPSSAQTGISQHASRKGLLGAFLNGVLMTLLSTPCSAPFLGTAMGFAFTQPPYLLVLFFTTVGLGLAFPYLMLSLFPATLKWIPKPGNWMQHFKQFLGFLMLVTAAWLLWVIGRQVGLPAMGALLLLLIALGFGAWILGIIAAPGNPFWKVGLGWMIVAFLGFGGWIRVVRPLLAAPLEKTNCAETGALQKDSDGWSPWSPSTAQALQAQGKTIFVDFTADWCLTCKTNEKAVLSQDTIRHTMSQMGVALLRGDFTRADPNISAILKSFGRSGVPLYVIYPAGQPSQPIVLSELLTVDQVLDALLKAGPSK
jgi:thiol:disulfide interchange protein DsbD